MIYGLDKAWLLKHPDVVNMNHAQLFNEVQKVNGLMIQAHPFRLRSSYMDSMCQHPYACHGIEVYNAGNYRKIENDMAALYAKAFNFPVTSGTDIHDVNVLNEPLIVGGMAFDKPLTDIMDYARRIKNYEGQII